MNNQRRLVMVLGAGALAAPLASLAQQKPSNVPRIGFLEAGHPSSIVARVEAFEQGLHELGYVEGKNIVIEYRYANGVFDRLPALAAEHGRRTTDSVEKLRFQRCSKDCRPSEASFNFGQPSYKRGTEIAPNRTLAPTSHFVKQWLKLPLHGKGA